MKVLKWFGALLALLVVGVVGSVFYLKSAAAERFEQTFDVAVTAIPIPFPLSEDELARVVKQRSEARQKENPAPPPEAEGAAEAEVAAAPAKSPEDLVSKDEQAKLALENAIARGKHYVDSRAACSECHAQDFGGKVIIDSPVMGTWIAPNITKGGKTKDYTAEDWVRLVRHGVKPDKHPASMPSLDYTKFSDQELSDIAAYISSLPAVDRVMPPSVLGPIFSLLIVKGEMPISAEVIDHAQERPKYPPALVANLELGEHLSHVCTGCHGPTLSGGPIPGGDPAWPAARNLTFHETGLGAWSLADFTKAMREGLRPDGATIDPAMPVAYTSKLKDEEIEGLYKYLKTLPPTPYGNH
jgi:mono/diheme cytochrome c family protein